jgi:hypothetical protein
MLFISRKLPWISTKIDGCKKTPLFVQLITGRQTPVCKGKTNPSTFSRQQKFSSPPLKRKQSKVQPTSSLLFSLFFGLLLQSNISPSKIFFCNFWPYLIFRRVES